MWASIVFKINSIIWRLRKCYIHHILQWRSVFKWGDRLAHNWSLVWMNFSYQCTWTSSEEGFQLRKGTNAGVPFWKQSIVLKSNTWRLPNEGKLKLFLTLQAWGVGTRVWHGCWTLGEQRMSKGLWRKLKQVEHQRKLSAFPSLMQKQKWSTLHIIHIVPDSFIWEPAHKRLCNNFLALPILTIGFYFSDIHLAF